MIKKEIVSIGNPILRRISEPYSEDEFNTIEIKEFVDNMFSTMKIEKGIGLAAPQIGINKRAIVFGMDVPLDRDNIKSIPFTALFNPRFENISDTFIEEYEGCLSAGALRGKVARYKNIYYSGLDLYGNLIEGEASDLHARAIQHEIDHLDGIIFLDKLSNYRTLGFHDELILAGAFQPR